MKHIINIDNENVNCQVVIKLDDDCKNGHEDFSITGSFWTPGYSRNDGNLIVAGCCHDEILKHLPHLDIFIKLHLHDFRGYPLYYIENGFYHLKHSKKEDFKHWYLITEQGYRLLSMADTKDEFAWLLIVFLKNNKKWENLAKEGIKELEKLTGKKFVSKATSVQEVKYLDGVGVDTYSNEYFKLENVEKRRNAKRENDIQKTLSSIENRFSQKINDLVIEKNLLIQVVKCGYPDISSAVYFPSSRSLKLNALTTGYQFTEDDFKHLKKMLIIPENINLEM